MADSYETIIGHDGDEKYIVARITNTVSKKQKLLIYSQALKYHSMIANHLEERLSPNEEMEVLGGGILVYVFV